MAGLFAKYSHSAGLLSQIDRRSVLDVGVHYELINLISDCVCACTCVGVFGFFVGGRMSGIGYNLAYVSANNIVVHMA